MIYWIANLIVIALASYLFFRAWGGHFSPILYGSALFLKLAAGLIVGWVFLNHYSGADTFSYFEKARSFAAQPTAKYVTELFTNSTYETTDKPRVLFFTKIVSVFIFFTGGSYWISSLYLSLTSFFASWWAVVKISGMYQSIRPIITICFLFIPTVVFWSSGILKDTISSSALLIAVTSTLTVYRLRRLSASEVIWVMLSLFILFRLKHYVLITFLLFVGLLFFLHYFRKTTVSKKIVAMLILVASIVGTQFVHPYLNFQRFPLTIFENNQAIIKKTDSEKQLNIEIDDPSWESILRETPKAIKTGLFRPSVFDQTADYGWLHKIENLIVILLTVISIFIWLKEHPRIDVPLAGASIVSILLLATILALSTPNFGTLVRYKNVFMPFYFLLVSILPNYYFASKRPE